MDDTDSQPSHGGKPPPPSLALAEVTWLWTGLSAVYGQRFLAQYDGVNLAAVKEDWRRRLAGTAHDQLQYALDNLQADRPPPDVLQVRRMAWAMPDERRLVRNVLPPPSKPRPAPEKVREVFDKLREPTPEPPHITTARRFIADHGAPGASLSDTQRNWLRHWQQVVARYEARQAAAAAEAADRERAERLARETTTNPGGTHASV